MTKTGFAEHADVSRSAIYKALKSGKLREGPGGEIDPVDPVNEKWLSSRRGGGHYRQKLRAQRKSGKPSAPRSQSGATQVIDTSGAFRIPAVPRASVEGHAVTGFLVFLIEKSAEHGGLTDDIVRDAYFEYVRFGSVEDG